MEIRGQELETAASADVDAMDRSREKKASYGAFRAGSTADAFTVTKAPVLSSPDGLSISFLKMR